MSHPPSFQHPREPQVLHTYRNVNKLKQLFRHMEGIPILPFPATITGVVVGFILLLILIYQPINWILKIIIPIVVTAFLSRQEVDGAGPVEKLYAHIRAVLKPNHRIVNREVDAEEGRSKPAPTVTTVVYRTKPGELEKRLRELEEKERGAKEK